MKFSNNFLAKVAQKIPFLYKLSASRQAKNKTQALSGSIVDKEVPLYKPLSMLLPTFIIVAFFTLIPLILNVKSAFTSETTKAFTFDNFQFVITKDPAFAVGFRNSIIYGLIVLPIVIMISLLISSSIVHVYRKWARGIWQTIFFLPYDKRHSCFTYFHSSFCSNRAI